MATIATLLTRVVRDVMAPPPPVAKAECGCAGLVRAMSEQAASCVVIEAPGGAPIGIVTERDIVRRAAFRADPDAPASDIMSAPLRVAAEDDLLYRAIGAMRRFGLRHMPVVDHRGRLCGMLNLRDALADAAAPTVALIDRLTHDATVEGLAAVKGAEVELAADMAADGRPAHDIQRLISHVNRDIHRRVVERAQAAMAEDGLGPAPVPFCFLVMGSGGRDESYLYPDQDNGIVIADYPDDRHAAIDLWFIDLSERVTRELDAIGFPFCQGGVMAINPVWRKTLSQWKEQTTIWARRRSVTAVRLADIFFDFQPAAGKASLAAALRRHVTALMRGNVAFLREIHHDQAAYGTALGMFGRLRTIAPDRPFPGQIDLKGGGLLVLVNTVRILALRDGVAATPTLARIAMLREIGALDADEADELSAAFHHISALLLTRQVACFNAGQPVGNAVPPGSLGRRDRRLLVEGLRAIERLRDRVGAELTGDVFGGDLRIG